MKKLLALVLPIACGQALIAQSQDAGPAATAEKLFQAMSAHDAAAARVLFTGDAGLTTVRPDGTITVVPREKWLQALGSSKEEWLERMWNTKVLEHGNMAVVWGDYDFHLGKQFSHCGVDSFNLVKSEGVWKIAGIFFTSEKTGCKPSALGAPSK